MSSTIPVILIGKTAAIGGPVAKLLQPEYEVVRFISTIEVAKRDIPALLSGQSIVPKEHDGVGNLDFSRKIQAILIGGAFSNEMVQEVRALSTDGSDVPWLVRGPDAEKRFPPPGPDYAAAAVRSIKDVLQGLKTETGELIGRGLYDW